MATMIETTPAIEETFEGKGGVNIFLRSWLPRGRAARIGGDLPRSERP